MSKQAVVMYGRRKRSLPSNDAKEKEEEEAEELQQRKSSALTPISPGTHKYKQYFLDFGQRDFSYSTCKLCGLLYARGHSDDDKLHALFHKQYIRGVLFKGWQKERLVVKHEKFDERIILVLHSDPLQHQLKVKELVKIMEKDLGTEPGWLLHDRCKVYLYISLKKVIGCAVSEPISQAYPVLCEKEPTAMAKACTQSRDLQSITSGLQLQPSCLINGLFSDMDGSFKRCHPSSDEISQSKHQRAVETASKHGPKTLVFGGIKFQRERVQRCNLRNPVVASEVPAICTKCPVAAVCGIRGLWVSMSERKRGIATYLMDAVRNSFTYGLILDTSQCAFSQPTPDGKAFAMKYSKTDRYLVYS